MQYRAVGRLPMDLRQEGIRLAVGESTLAFNGRKLADTSAALQAFITAAKGTSSSSGSGTPAPTPVPTPAPPRLPLPRVCEGAETE